MGRSARALERVAARARRRTAPRGSLVAVALHWSPGVEVVATRTPWLLEATDPDGRALRDVGEAGDVLRAATAPGATEFALSLAPPAGADVHRLARLEVAVPLRIRHRRVSVRFAGLARLPRSLPPPANAGTDGAGAVTLQAVRPPEAAGAPWTVEVRVRLPAPPRPAGRGRGRDRRRHPRHGGLPRPRRRRDAARGPGPSCGPAARAPAALRVAWYGAEEDAEARFRWGDVPLR